MTNNNTGTTKNNAEIIRTTNSRQYAEISLNNNGSSAGKVLSIIYNIWKTFNDYPIESEYIAS